MEDFRGIPWHRIEGLYDICKKCHKEGIPSHGRMSHRKIIECSGEIRNEYRIECPRCGDKTDAHQSMLLTEKEWEGRQR